LLAYILGEKDPEKYVLAKDFLEGLAPKGQQAILSNLALMEILAVLRSNKSKEFKTLNSINGWDRRLTYVIDGANTMYNELIEICLKLQVIRFMPMAVNIDISQLLLSALQILSAMRGRVQFQYFCSGCGRKKGEYFLSAHKCVGTVDIIHALLAKELKCNKLVTFDRGFEELITESRIQPLDIKVMKPPKR
jgi:predicted nucleic acid-binding protein